jgi:hypothetical protein
MRKPTDAGIMVPCPCCGYPTLSQRNMYDICELCGWEDDGQDDENADKVFGGPNASYSLTQARANFEQRLIMFDPDSRRSNTPVEQEAKRAIVDAFDLMMSERRYPVREQLWQQVVENEAVLRSELNRRVHEIERQARERKTAGES